VAREIYTAITNPATDLPTGPQLRTTRLERGLTQQTLSTALGVSNQAISRLERGLAHDHRLARRIRDWLHDAA
jgi:transposase